MNLCLTTLYLCLGLALGAPRIDSELDSHWQLWKSWHNKDYHEVSAGHTCSARQVLSAFRRALPAESYLLCFYTDYGLHLGRIILFFLGPWPRFVHRLSCTVLFVFITRGAKKTIANSIQTSDSSNLQST